MSDATRICLVGATGLIGGEVMQLCVGREDIRLSAVARREAPLPQGARMELFVADPANWGEVLEALKPKAVICALGTTWKKSGEDETAFRAVDYDLVMATAQAAKDNDVKRFVAISSVGASIAAKTFYLRVKGETERDLMKMGFERLDILRPGLLLGSRQGDRRVAERTGIVLAPLINPFLQGKYRKYRAIEAKVVAQAALAMATNPARGRFVHDNDGIIRAAKRLPQLVTD